MPKAKINYALAASLVTSGVSLADAAPQVGAKNANVLQVGLRRKGVIATQARLLEPTGQRQAIIAQKLVSQASQALREDFSKLLADHIKALTGVAPRSNLKHIKAVGEALEPLARTAKIVHGWGSEADEGLVRKARFVEIESSCVPEHTSSGVPAEKQVEQKPQEVKLLPES